jgi:hypothetical protein
MRRIVWWLIALFGAGVFAAILYNAVKKPVSPPAPPAPAVSEPARPEPAEEPRIRHPLAEQPPEKPLPALDVSDSTIKAELDALLQERSFVEIFLLKDFIRRVVTTIDNLPREKVAQRIMPVKPVGGPFLVAGADANPAVSADNAKRYALHMKLLAAVDTAKLVAFYVRYYPLFQQAYRELGYPKGYFNDRLVEVIDHLLGAPEPDVPVKLVRPKVFYQYADPALEAQSAGRKVLMRIGRENAAAVKAKLREIRAELAKHAPKS